MYLLFIRILIITNENPEKSLERKKYQNLLERQTTSPGKQNYFLIVGFYFSLIYFIYFSIIILFMFVIVEATGAST